MKHKIHKEKKGLSSYVNSHSSTTHIYFLNSVCKNIFSNKYLHRPKEQEDKKKENS